jgi:Leucine-rich repeat (LRR) protein
VPEAVFRDVGLLELDVSDNRIEGALPAEIRRLQTLEVLDASGNKMTGVPAEIGQLRELRILNLADNDLTGLPRELGNLQKLELLDVSGNPYSEIDLEGIRSALPATTVIRQ